MNLARRQLVAATAAITCTALGPALVASPARAQGSPLKFGVGMFQPDREKNDATYRPLAQHLSQRLGRPVELRTVDSWEGLAKSLARVAVTPCAAEGRRFGLRVADVWVDAVAVEVDADAWQQRFLRQWSEGSDAHVSYFGRITRGPSYRVAEALRIEE